MTKVSFIAPAYNVNKYLDDFFLSFKGVERERFEIIFVDDKSPENTQEYFDKYKNDFNIKYVKNKTNLGLGFARNEGLKYVGDDSTHVIYIDTDDVINDKVFLGDVQPGKITWFNCVDFDKKKSKYWNKNRSFGNNFFPNTIWGVAIPVEIAKANKFESTKFEDGIVNRRLIKNHKDISMLSSVPLIGYRRRKSSITGSKPTVEKFTIFVSEFKKLIDEGHNTYRFNIQEIYQYYWMWRGYLKGFDKSLLPKTKFRYRIAFCLTGSAIRFLRLERLIYGRGNKNAFD